MIGCRLNLHHVYFNAPVNVNLQDTWQIRRFWQVSDNPPKWLWHDVFCRYLFWHDYDISSQSEGLHSVAEDVDNHYGRCHWMGVSDWLVTLCTGNAHHDNVTIKHEHSHDTSQCKEIGTEHLSVHTAQVRKGLLCGGGPVYIRDRYNNTTYVSLIHGTLRKDFVILQLYRWLFSSTKHSGWNMV